MTKEEKVQLTYCLTGAAEVLGREISPVALELYLGALDDLPIDLVTKAISGLVQKIDFLPTPSQIRAGCGRAGLSVNEEALIEAAKVEEAARNVSDYNDVVFDNPITMAVLNDHFGGWPPARDAVLNRENRREPFAKEFERNYAAFSKARIERGGVLRGRRYYKQESKLTYIGDTERAKEVQNLSTHGLTFTEAKLLEGE